MKVSFAIMAHPSREDFVNELQKQLDQEVPVVFDSKDDEWDTARSAWLAYTDDADWHVVIQDDAMPCKRLCAGIAKALENVPSDRPVSFYSGKPIPDPAHVLQAIEQAEEKSKSWWSWKGPMWGVCIAVPTWMINDMVKAGDEEEIEAYDVKLASVFKKADVECWYSVPSLVNHREGTSLIDGKKEANRSAYNWIGRRTTAKIDWSGGVARYRGMSSAKWMRTMDGIACGVCGELFKTIPDVIVHHAKNHDLGPVDLVASKPETEEMMQNLYDRLPEEARGNLFIVGSRKLPQRKALRIITRSTKNFVVVDNTEGMKYVQGRNAWSMDNRSYQEA